MSSTFIRSTVVIFHLLLACYVTSHGTVEATTIEIVRKSTLDYVRTIHSIEYEVGEAVGTNKDATRRLKYWQQGNMFRGESSFGNGGDTWISAYNESRYQMFFKEQGVMSLKNTSAVPNPTRIMGPPTLAFSWLAQSRMTFAWSDMTSEENINARFAKAKYIGEKRVAGDICTVLQFPGVVDGSTVDVWFSKEKSFFPVKHVLKIGRREIAEVNITSFETVLLEDNNSVLIPMVVSGTNRPDASKPAKVMTTSIVPNSLKINQKYDDDFFTLPTTLAKTVNDLDKLEAAGLLDPPYDLSHIYKKPERSWTLFIVVNAIGIILLVYFFIKRRSR